MKPDVNIIIICWNALDYTRATVESLIKKTNYPFALTLVDNGSTDKTLEYLKSLKISGFLNRIYIIHNKDNMGVGYAYNQGLSISVSNGYTFSCFCNNDLFFSSNWLTILIRAINSNPNIALVNPLRPSCRTKYGPHLSSIQKLLSIKETTDWKKELEEYTEMSIDHFDNFVEHITHINGKGIEIIKFPDSLSTCVCLARTDVFSKLGYFADTSFPKYGSEDIDMCWTLMEKGYDCAVCKDTYVHHFRGKSIKNLDRKKLLSISNKILYKKWKQKILHFLSNVKNIDQVLAKDNETESWLLSQIDKDINFKKELEYVCKHAIFYDATQL